MDFDLDYAAEVFPTLLAASVVNIEAAFLGFAIALVAGLGLALARKSGLPLLTLVATSSLEFVRGTPFLIQLYFIFYVLPNYGLKLDPLATGVLALGLNFSSYTAEVYRAGIEAVPRGQWEAATALNLPVRRIWRRIVLPQAIPPMVPALGNYLIGMFKETAILATISVNELLGTAQVLATLSFRSVEPMTMVAILFLAMSLTGAMIVRALERRRRAAPSK